ncbi:hypothetical protein Y032_0113g365 [Ancylostoma ceylanicum]|nr:hypothetical protein Y032_0113g365 [Ancylostoma ceylanicum]
MWSPIISLIDLLLYHGIIFAVCIQVLLTCRKRKRASARGRMASRRKVRSSNTMTPPVDKSQSADQGGTGAGGGPTNIHRYIDLSYTF